MNKDTCIDDAPVLKSVCVFCGSSPGRESHYAALATALGRELAASGLRLVYGGGRFGLMGATAMAAHDAGGAVLGIIPEFLVSKEGLYDEVEHVVVKTMHERKARMYAEADAFIVLPGGIGTLEETVEVLSWARLQLHAKPMAFLSENGFWSPLLALFRHTIAEKFTPAAFDDLLFEAETPRAAIDGLADLLCQPVKPALDLRQM